jgi:hypothetical protein
LKSRITYTIENIFISKSQKFGLGDRILFWSTGIFIVCINKFPQKSKSQLLDQSPLNYVDPTKYVGSNCHANSISSILEKIQSPIVKHALIHGSIASDEVINYSDIDTALFINSNKLKYIKDLILWNKIIKLTYKEMLKHDILQHHGWVIINLKHFPILNNRVISFPILREAKSLYVQNNEQFKIGFFHDKYSLSNFRNLVNSINRKIENKEVLKSLYIFKIFISELLLLPTVYLQFKLQEDISKKSSFEMIYQHLNSQDVDTIKQIENIRISWPSLNINNERLSLKDMLNKQKMLKTSEEHLQWFNKSKVNIQSLLTNLDRTIHQP